MHAVHPTSIGLTYYPDTRPGIVRRRSGTGFSYIAPDGTCNDKRSVIAALAIPPASEDVWISPRQNGHLIATGRDTRLRKQYMDHPRLTEARALAKHDRLDDPSAALCRIRGWIARNLSRRCNDERHAVAATLALIDRFSLRVGKPAHAPGNGSYGATKSHAVQAAAECLCNTPAVARDGYVQPDVLDALEAEYLTVPVVSAARRGLRKGAAALACFLGGRRYATAPRIDR